MRVLVFIFFGNTHQVEQFNDTVIQYAGGIGRQVFDDRFLDLIANRADGVQRIHGALKDDRDAAPAQLFQLFFVERSNIFTLENDMTIHDLSRGGEQAHQRQHQRGLSATALPHQPDQLTFM